ncbi:MAG: hypothetical protein KHW80_10520 [Faecalibacterium sp.]|nr:hypothetical protein [Faecalibacterium sp.]
MKRRSQGVLRKGFGNQTFFAQLMEEYFEGLLAVNREICMMQMAEKTSPDAPPNCAVVP